MATHDEFTEDDWMPEERALLSSLSRERIPPHGLKARTIDAVRHRAFSERRPAMPTKRVLAFLAASSLIFIAGALVGFAVAQRSAKPVDDSRMATREAVAQNVKPDSQPTRHIVWY